LAPNCFPIYQWFATDGFLFYSNAYDETTYLAYDVSIKTQSLSRVSQYLVSGMHQLGFSGGIINFIFDIFFPVFCFILISKIFILLKFNSSKAYLSALLIQSIPIIFGRSNPLFVSLLDFHISSGIIQWFAIPEAFYPPTYRSPEPQFSLAIISLAIYIGLKKSSLIPLYLVIPLLYPFVRIPFFFVIMTLHMLNSNKSFLDKFCKSKLVASSLISYIAISILILIYYKFAISGTRTEVLIIESRAPMLSFTGIVSVLLYLLSKIYVQARFKPFLCALTLSPFVAVNTQVISGVLVQPINYEQNYGTVCVAILIAFIFLSIKSYNWSTRLAGITALCLFLVYAKMVYNLNSLSEQKQPQPAKVIEILRSDASRIIVNNSALASALNLITAKQKITGTSISQSFAIMADNYFSKYLCMKMNILKNQRFLKDNINILDQLDEGYKYLHSNFIYIHINRKNKFTTFYDPDAIPKFCPEMKLYYYSMNN